MWLAVFDGLFFPLLALDGVIAYLWLVLAKLFARQVLHMPDSLFLDLWDMTIWIALASASIAWVDYLIIRAAWRAVNKNITAPENPTRRPRFGWWFVIACAVLLGFLGMAALHKSAGFHTATKLADSPQDLQKATTAQVIVAALENKESPWAWQELERRPLTAAEVAQIMDGLVAWLQRDFPNGHPNPLNWLDNSLERLDARHLFTDEQKVRLLTALHGNLRIEPLPRLHEGDWRLTLDGECRWTWGQDFLGLTMMNGPISVSVDGQPLPPNKDYPGSWTWSYPRINATWPLPALAVGRHIVKVENVSALVAKEDLTGLSSTAPPSDWPPAKKRWNRAVELELNVYPRDAVLVQQTQEPALDPVRNGSLSVNPVIIRSKGNGAQATLTFNLPSKDSVPVSFDVAMHIGGQTISCGSLWAVQTSHGETCSGIEQSADLPVLAAAINQADIILTPNPKPIEHIAAVERIWGGQIIFSNVPLKRLDLNTSAQSLSFDAFVERVRKELSRASVRFDKLHISAVNDNSFIVSFSGLEAHGVKDGKDAWIPMVGSVGELEARRSLFGGNWELKGFNQLGVARFTIANLDLEKLLETNLAEATPTPPTAAQNLSFGPVVEQVIAPVAPNPDGFVYVNLEKNELMTSAVTLNDERAGGDPVPHTGRFFKWIAESNADFAVYLRGTNVGLVPLGTRMFYRIHHPEIRDDFAQWTPLEVRSMVTDQEGPSGFGAMQKAPSDFGSMDGPFLAFPTLPASYVIQTWQGAIGILQIAGFTNNPPGVKIRYKLVQSANSSSETDSPTLAEQPPVVVETFPVSGARNVPPGDTEVRVRFSKPMMDKSWSWSTAWENSEPEYVGEPHYLDDHRTCVVKVRLEPGKTYGWRLNSEKFKGFKDRAGQPAVPYLLIFVTKGEQSHAGIEAELNHAVAESSPGQREAEFTRICRTIKPADIPFALSFLAQKGDTGVHSPFGDLASEWADKNASAALAWATNLPDASARKSALINVLKGWTHASPESAAAYTATLPDGELHDDAVIMVANEWSFSDAHGAANWVSHFPKGALRDKAVGPVIFWGQGQAPAAVAEMLDTIGDAELIQKNGETLASIWLTRDEAAARAWITKSSLSEEVKQRLLKSK